MKLLKSLVVALVAVSVFGMSSSVFAAEKKVEKKVEKAVVETVTVVGTVAVVKDTKGEVTSVSLKADDGAEYQVMLNAEGKALEKDNGKKVEATGTVADKAGKKVLHVKSSKAAGEAAK